MLSSWERRELAVIERSLSRQDPALARTLVGTSPGDATIRRRCRVVAAVTSMISCTLLVGSAFSSGAGRVVVWILTAEFALVAAANLFLARRGCPPPPP